MQLKHYIVPIGLILSIVSCKDRSADNNTPAQEEIPVTVMALRQDTLKPDIQTSGYFTTDNETVLSFKNGGIIDRIYVHEGDAVKAGQLLATVKAVEVKAAYEQASIAYEKAKRDYGRATHLYRDSVATLEQMQNAKTALDMALQQKTAAQFNRQHSEIRSLQNGYVLKRFLNPGQLAGPGTPVLLVTGTARGQWLFKTDLSDAQWASLRIGDSAVITTDIAPDAPMPASVFRKGEGIDPSTGGFTVQLSVKDRKGINLATGLFGKATLYPSRTLTAWRIPYDALLDGDASSGYVFVTRDQKHAEKVKVHLSGISHGYVAVDSGLEEIPYLIISGSAYLKDGATIKVTK